MTGALLVVWVCLAGTPCQPETARVHVSMRLEQPTCAGASLLTYVKSVADLQPGEEPRWRCRM